MSERLRCLIAGFGNELAGDDAVGLVLLERLSREALPEGCRTAAPRSPLDLVDLLEHADRAVFLDAVSSGASPGTIHVLAFPSPEVVPRSSLSTHGWSLADAVAFVERLGRLLPPIALVGIEAANVRNGQPMSEPVAAAIDDCVRRIVMLLSAREGVFPPGTGPR